MLVAEAGPCRKPINVEIPSSEGVVTVFVTIDAVPTVQGEPEIVRAMPVPVAKAGGPLVPSGLSGTTRLAAGVLLQAANRHTMETPLTGMGPPSSDSGVVRKLPVLLLKLPVGLRRTRSPEIDVVVPAATAIPAIGNAPASGGTTTLANPLKAPMGTAREVMSTLVPEPLIVAVPEPGMTTGSSTPIDSVKTPSKPRVAARADPAARTHAPAASRMDSLSPARRQRAAVERSSRVATTDATESMNYLSLALAPRDTPRGIDTPGAELAVCL